ncbi:hypothetical protein HGRIS_008181 [Hohenbuehelia grisea]|uniref:RRM domain-containing protein n=1 Tax=Hohenbuehelia grisea TaxID=104357 RepID=A0ABR3J773_9AGAR
MPHLSAVTRVWGTRFDHLASSPPPSPPSVRPQGRSERTPRSSPQPAHDNSDMEQKLSPSIFVGNLPALLDDEFLKAALAKELSPYGGFGIKIVKNEKGPAYGFIKCESPTAAEQLLHALHNAPTIYIEGRDLRFEQARAYSVLYISYCTPTKYTRGTPSSDDDEGVDFAIPGSMTIVARPKASKPDAMSKTYQISYDISGADLDLNEQEDALTLQPLQCNADTIRKIAEFFGPLARLDLYNDCKGVDETTATGEEAMSYPEPHDGPRNPDMDPRCWRVEWVHRDDCAIAEIALRSVPLINATWAHVRANERSLRYGTPRFPHSVSMGLYNSPDRPNHSLSRRIIPSSPLSYPNFRHFDVRGPRTTRNAENSPSSRGTPPTVETDHLSPPKQKLSWGDMEFPSLNDPVDEKDYPADSLSVSEMQNNDDDRTPRAPLATLDIQTYRHYEGDHGLTSSPTTPLSPESFPPTPTNANIYQADVELVDEGDHHMGFENRGRYERHGAFRHHNTREHDPFTLFIGDLITSGPDAWDEARLNDYFAPLPGLIEVKVYRKPYTPSYAFVGFDNVQSPRQAVAGERQRKLNGEPHLHARLREILPKGQRFGRMGRGRGAMLHGGFRRQTQDPVHRLLPPRDEVALTPSSSSELVPFDEREKLGTQVSLEVKEQRKSVPQGNPYPQVHGANEPVDSGTPPPAVDATSPPYVAANGPTVLHPAMNTGYYPSPPPWGMPPPGPYPPYFGHHMGYMVPSGVVGNGVDPGYFHGHLSYIPYPAFPTRPSHTESSQGQTNEQPPVRATGFIRQDEGPLYAVYNPDDLTKYMASEPGPGNQAPPPGFHSPHPHPAGVPGQAQLVASNSAGNLHHHHPPGWVQFPQAPPYTPHPHGGPHMPTHHSRHFPHGGPPPAWTATAPRYPSTSGSFASSASGNHLPQFQDSSSRRPSLGNVSPNANRVAGRA